MNFISCLLIFTLMAQSGFSATLQAGTPSSGGTAPNATASPNTPNSPLTPPEPNQILTQLQSDKSYEIRNALNQLNTFLPSYLQDNVDLTRQMGFLFGILASNSENNRSQAISFLQKNKTLLFANRLLSPELLQNLANESTQSPTKLLSYLSTIYAILPLEDLTHILEGEQTHQIIEALGSESDPIAKSAESILIAQGENFAKVKIWTKLHTRKFLDEFKDASENRFDLFFKVFTSNFSHWVKYQLVDREHIMEIMNRLRSLTPEIRHNFLDFFTAEKNVTVLKNLGILSQDLTQNLVQDITSSTEERSRSALEIFSVLLRPLAQVGASTQSDFRKVWDHISKNLSAYDNGFDFASHNLVPLLKSGWFTQKDYETLVTQHTTPNSNTLENFMQFLSEHYDHFNAYGWISATPLVPILLDSKLPVKTLAKRLDFIEQHTDLFLEKSLFGPKEFEQLQKWALAKDNTLSHQAILILDTGFSNFVRQKFITKESITKLLESAQLNWPGTAKLIHIFNEKFPRHPELFPKDNLALLADFYTSSLPQNQNAVLSFFTNHWEQISKERSLRNGLKSKIKKAGFWEDLPQNQRKK